MKERGPVGLATVGGSVKISARPKMNGDKRGWWSARRTSSIHRQSKMRRKSDLNNREEESRPKHGGIKIDPRLHTIVKCMPLPELDQYTMNSCTSALLKKKAEQEKAFGPDLQQTPTKTTTMNSDFKTSIVESLVVDHANYRCALQVRSCLDGYQC